MQEQANLGDDNILAAQCRSANAVALRMLDDDHKNKDISNLISWFDKKQQKRQLLLQPWTDLVDHGYNIAELRSAGIVFEDLVRTYGLNNLIMKYNFTWQQCVLAGITATDLQSFTPDYVEHMNIEFDHLVHMGANVSSIADMGFKYDVLSCMKANNVLMWHAIGLNSRTMRVFALTLQEWAELLRPTKEEWDLLGFTNVEHATQEGWCEKDIQKYVLQTNNFASETKQNEMPQLIMAPHAEKLKLNLIPHPQK